MIQMLEYFLRQYVERHPQTWSQYLALAEFAANNAINVAIGYNPFYLNSGDQPPCTISSNAQQGCVEQNRSCADNG